MSASGYQSDLRLSDQTFEGNLPVENNIGGFGTATGVNNYVLSLSPPLSSGYIEGLLLMVKFNTTNTANATLNVDGKGSVPLRQLSGGVFTEIDPGTIVVGRVYLLGFDGAIFQMITLPGMEDFVEATEQQAGVVRIATQTETDTGVIDNKLVSPLKLQEAITKRINESSHLLDKGNLTPDITFAFPEGVRGDVYMVDSNGIFGGEGEDDGILLEIGDLLICAADNEGGTLNEVGNDWIVVKTVRKQATTDEAGVLAIASFNDILELTSGDKAVTPLRLKDALDNLPKPAEVLFKSLNRFEIGVNPVGIVSFGDSSTLLSGTLNQNQGLHILVSGTIAPEGLSTLYLYVGSQQIFSGTVDTLLEVEYQVQLQVYRISTAVLKGYAVMNVNGNPTITKLVETATLDIDNTDHQLSTRAENPTQADNFIARETFVITKIN